MNVQNEKYHIQKAIQGDVSSWKVLIDKHKDLVFAVAFKTLRNKVLAEEVSQEVFIKMYKSLATFKGDSKLSTWLYRITYRTCLDAIKSSKNKKNTSIEDIIMPLSMDYNDAIVVLEREERKESVAKCMNALSEEDRYLLTLFYFEELHLKEIATIVELTVNTVKVKIHRARKRIAKHLLKELEPETLELYGQRK